MSAVDVAAVLELEGNEDSVHSVISGAPSIIAEAQVLELGRVRQWCVTCLRAVVGDPGCAEAQVSIPPGWSIVLERWNTIAIAVALPSSHPQRKSLRRKLRSLQRAWEREHQNQTPSPSESSDCSSSISSH